MTNLSTKKRVIIVCIIVIIILAAILIIYYFKKRKATTPVTKNTIVREIKPVADILQAQLIFPNLNNGKISFINKEAPEFKTIDLSNLKISIIADASKLLQKGSVQKVIWSPNQQKIFLLMNENQTKIVCFWLFDLTTKKIQSLDPNIKDIVWINESQILYSHLNSNTDQYNFSIASPDGTNWKEIMSLKDITVGTIFGYNQQTNKIIFGTAGDLNNQVYVADIKTGSATEIFRDYSMAIMDKSINNIAYVALNQPKQLIALNLANNQKSNYSFDFNIRNFAFGEKNIFLAAQTQNLNDDLFLINIENKKITKIQYNIIKSQVSTENLLPDKNDQTLYFTSNDLLYKIDIP